MIYMRCAWHHTFEDEPVMLFCELDDDRIIRRAVERFRDGRLQYGVDGAVGEIVPIEIVPVPPLETINADPQFEAVAITAGEFEAVWAQAAKKQ